MLVLGMALQTSIGMVNVDVLFGGGEECVPLVGMARIAAARMTEAGPLKVFMISKGKWHSLSDPEWVTCCSSGFYNIRGVYPAVDLRRMISRLSPLQSIPLIILVSLRHKWRWRPNHGEWCKYILTVR